MPNIRCILLDYNTLFRVLRGKDFDTPTPLCPVIFCPNPDRTQKSEFYDSTRTGPDWNILSPTQNCPVSDYNKPLNTTWNETITSYSMLIRAHCTYSIWACEAWFPFNSILSQKFSEKIYDTLVKNTPTRTELKSLSPTRPDPTRKYS